MSSLSSKEGGSDKDIYKDLSEYDLHQLTHVLCMTPDINVGKPDKAWLDNQEARITELNEAIRCSGTIIGRISTYFDRYRNPDKMAHLCPAHQGLNPRLIRSLFLLLVAECSERTDRLRVWRRRLDLAENITAWLDRIDNVSGMWIGRKAFRAVFGYDRASSSRSLVRQDCEACIMSAIGGRPQVLSDLRASLIARSGKYPRNNRGEPRLLRLVEAWIGHFVENCITELIDGSNGLASEIRTLQDDLRRQKDERDKLRKGGSKASRSSRRGRSERKSERENESRASYLQQTSVYRSSQENSRTDRGGDGYLDRRTEDAEPIREEHEEPPTPDSSDSDSIKEEEQTPEDKQGYATSNWIDDQMQSQGLPPEARRQTFADMHPAFSEYVAPSAVPPPLFIRHSKPPQRPANPPESDWEPVSVHSLETESNASTVRPRRDPAPPLQRSNANTSMSPLDGEEDPYFAFCEKWGLDPDPKFGVRQPQAPSPGNLEVPEQGLSSPSSSVYSAHPGFRRSQGGGWEDDEEIAFRDPFDPDNSRGRSRRNSTRSVGSSTSTRSSQISPRGTRHRYPAVSKSGTTLENPDETRVEK